MATVKSRFSDSPIWKAIMKVKECYMAGRDVLLGSGNIARLQMCSFIVGLDITSDPDKIV